MAGPNPHHRKPRPAGSQPATPDGNSGHPSVEQLTAEQGSGPITDISELRGSFWPEEETVRQFLDALHEWRGHKQANPAA